ncbi:hypothetical protein LTR37_011591 [Vermiconidia calcicola]|uniref:Uncharacterized protein n=1 Tax=Vermiconidia calcicola TaxID=1690605 RepID=A0ACC3N392_9PEZI|nr:hypothetical protein LTR37_011591 [Vermiconidia calcicola]
MSATSADPEIVKCYSAICTWLSEMEDRYISWENRIFRLYERKITGMPTEGAARAMLVSTLLFQLVVLIPGLVLPVMGMPEVPFWLDMYAAALYSSNFVVIACFFSIAVMEVWVYMCESGIKEDQATTKLRELMIRSLKQSFVWSIIAMTGLVQLWGFVGFYRALYVISLLMRYDTIHYHQEVGKTVKQHTQDIKRKEQTEFRIQQIQKYVDNDLKLVLEKSNALHKQAVDRANRLEQELKKQIEYADAMQDHAYALGRGDELVEQDERARAFMTSISRRRDLERQDVENGYAQLNAVHSHQVRQLGSRIEEMGQSRDRWKAVALEMDASAKFARTASEKLIEKQQVADQRIRELETEVERQREEVERMRELHNQQVRQLHSRVKEMGESRDRWKAAALYIDGSTKNARTANEELEKKQRVAEQRMRELEVEVERQREEMERMRELEAEREEGWDTMMLPPSPTSSSEEISDYVVEGVVDDSAGEEPEFV